MVVESLAGWPSLLIVGLLFVGYYASWRHIIPLMALTVFGALAVAIYFGSPLGILLDIPEDMTNWELIKAVGPSVMIVISAAIGYLSAFRHRIVHTCVMGFLMVTSLVMGW